MTMLYFVKYWFCNIASDWTFTNRQTDRQTDRQTWPKLVVILQTVHNLWQTDTYVQIKQIPYVSPIIWKRLSCEWTLQWTQAPILLLSYESVGHFPWQFSSFIQPFSGNILSLTMLQ